MAQKPRWHKYVQQYFIIMLKSIKRTKKMLQHILHSNIVDFCYNSAEFSINWIGYGTRNARNCYTTIVSKFRQ